MQNGIQNRSNPFLFIRIFLCGFLYSFIHSFRMGKRNELEKVAYWMETSTMVKIRYFNGGGMATKIKKIQMDEYFHRAFKALWSSMVHDVYYINVNTPEQFFLLLSSLFIVGYIICGPVHHQNMCIWKQIVLQSNPILNSGAPCLHYYFHWIVLHATLEGYGTDWPLFDSFYSLNSVTSIYFSLDFFFLFSTEPILNFNFVLLPEGCLKMNNETYGVWI